MAPWLGALTTNVRLPIGDDRLDDGRSPRYPQSSSPTGRSASVTVPASGAVQRPASASSSAHPRLLVGHVVGGDAVAHLDALRSAGVVALQPLHLRVVLDPVRPAVRAARRRCPARSARSGWWPAPAPAASRRCRPPAATLHGCAVVDARHHRRHRDLVGRHAGLLGQPLGAARVSGARAQRVAAHAGRGNPHRHRLGWGRVGVVEDVGVGATSATLRATSASTGAFRKARMIPPGPTESATCMTTP